MSNYADLVVWQRAHRVAVQINLHTRHWPEAIAPGLRAQLVRASASIAANIAEGASGPSNAQFARYTAMAIASTNEVDNHLKYARDIGLLDPASAVPFLDQTAEIRRMLHGLLTYLKRKKRRFADHDASTRALNTDNQLATDN